ncbi:DUF1206 domain-containing protein [Methylobacterium nonmethylotrophicum]|uniref:DUF1206 domain-containing protein n=1 Tax=Methylobacterium nonmethylotrophicum TaxID=1141884 RepID=A0A4Z0NU37_9HYPH|nr:DUF1206 domain-containing protein [Methylobacterium nonmethylotrophicum]TGE00551.1 DUF1206 domain-containing protein [Methylobacterium nonmethylotrophicum]
MRPDGRQALELLARLGYGARGITYCLVGGLAVLAAVGVGGQTGGSRSALLILLGKPFGWILLGLIAFGLAAFALWRVVEAVTDADGYGRSAKGLATRAGHLVSGVIYGGLALSMAKAALGRGTAGSDDQGARDWTAWLLQQPFGQWLVGAVGLVVIGAGFAFARKAWRGDVTRRLSVPHDARDWARHLGRFGYAARALTFGLIGGFLIAAAIESRSSDVKGLGGALQALRAEPYGWVLLAVTAAGLAAFGVFGLVQARYRRIDPPDLDAARRAVKDITR